MSLPADASVFVALVSLAIWIVLLSARGGFWRCRERDEREAQAPAAARWPAVVAIVPARNEAELLSRSLGSLLRQDYPGSLSVVLVDDDSEDATLETARGLAAADGRLSVLSGSALPAGWTGKLWALHQGIRHAGTRAGPRPEYFLLTDADIDYAAGALRGLVRRAQATGLVLVSRMAKLRRDSLAERALVPAFVFFFQMLYPFAWVNRPTARTAAAAGGCALVEAAALERAGGIAAIRSALIDDCALAARLKRQGPIRLSLTEHVRSLRPYPGIGDIRRMVARSAYAQLRYSPWLLAAALVGLAVAFLAAPVITLLGDGPARGLAAAAWLLSAAAYLPILRFYRASPLWAPALPAIAAVYLCFTLDSAIQHLRGRGGSWKGRAQALRANVPWDCHGDATRS